MRHGYVTGLLAMALICGAADAMSTGWDESANGELSNNYQAPTPVPLAVGANPVTGSVHGNPGIDRDYFRITVPEGAVLTSITLLNNTFVSGGASFFGMQAGPAFTVDPDSPGANIGDLLGYTHYDNSLIGTNILPAVRGGSTAPLPAGTYSIWIQETGGPVDYGVNFLITSTAGAGMADVPTLPEWGAILMGSILLMLIWRQRSPRS